MQGWVLARRPPPGVCSLRVEQVSFAPESCLTYQEDLGDSIVAMQQERKREKCHQEPVGLFGHYAPAITLVAKRKRNVLVDSVAPVTTKTELSLFRFTLCSRSPQLAQHQVERAGIETSLPSRKRPVNTMINLFLIC